MFGSSLSRWTMLHFGVAICAFVVAQIIMVAGCSYPAAPLLAPATLITVHLLTLGWLTLLMLGALHQFVPVITGQPAAAQSSALVSLLGIGIGLAAMVLGFLALAGAVPSTAVAALPIGGLFVLGGTLLAVWRLAPVLWRARPLTLPARFVLAAFGFLLVTVGLGLTFGAIFACPTLFPWGRFMADGLRLHVMGGVLGWFSLIALGVSYRLLSMFMLAPEERGWLGESAFLLITLGLAATWLVGLVRATGIAIPEFVLDDGEAIVALGIALYLADMALLYRARRRRALELNSRTAAAALGALAASLVLAVAFGGADRLEEVAGPIGYLFVFGWLSGLGVSQLYKIVPFLTWIQRYGTALGKGPVPRVQDLVCEPRARPWFVLYFVSVAAGTAFGLISWPELWRLAIAGHLLATLAIARELWCARYREPRTTAQPQHNSPVQPANPTARHPDRVAHQGGSLT
ncbi:MAG TPA: hypothetical protein VKY65_22535 [Alphaproteobacteria bacterium]|nr:hypothetical protein [Alphaproteobacteria bacterium]